MVAKNLKIHSSHFVFHAATIKVVATDLEITMGELVT
jgi:hypothetical protein